jgi:hypothetical protein
MSMTGIKTGLPWKSSAHTLNSNGLGALGAAPNKAGRATVGTGDPIEEYGNKVTIAILEGLSELPESERGDALKEIMNKVDPKIYSVFKKERKRAEGAGASKSTATHRGIAVAFKKGFVGELVRIGKGRKTITPGAGKGAVPLGMSTGFTAQASNYQGLGGFLSTIKSTVNKIGGFACDVSTHPLTPLAAGAAGAAAGGPGGAGAATTGAGIAAAACSSGNASDIPFAPARQGMPSWAIPAIIGGGLLTLVVILK